MNILKEFRLKNKVKQLQLSKISDIRHTTLSLIENDWTPLSEINTKKLVSGYRKLNIDASRVIHNFLKQKG